MTRWWRISRRSNAGCPEPQLRKVKDIKAVAPIESLSRERSETTDLERRVLAHERVLQALIAYMARTEPRFIDHLSERFVEPMRTARREHDYRETDDYAEEFMRAVMLLGEARMPRPNGPEIPNEHLVTPGDKGGQGPSNEQPAQRERVQVRERSGIWEVKVDGKFHGDYHQKEHALAAAALIKLSVL